MPERGPVQLLLHFLRLRQAPGWKIGLAVALVATLGLLPGEESLYQKAKTGLAQSLRQAAWTHALAGEPQPKPWPWDQATPAVNSVVPRLGLSAAIHCDDAKTSEQTSEPARKPVGIDARDPHLASDDAGIAEDADAVRVDWRRRFSLSKTATTGSGSRARRHRPPLHRPTALLSTSQFPVPST